MGERPQNALWDYEARRDLAERVIESCNSLDLDMTSPPNSGSKYGYGSTVMSRGANMGGNTIRDDAWLEKYVHEGRRRVYRVCRSEVKASGALAIYETTVYAIDKVTHRHGLLAVNIPHFYKYTVVKALEGGKVVFEEHAGRQVPEPLEGERIGFAVAADAQEESGNLTDEDLDNMRQLFDEYVEWLQAGGHKRQRALRRTKGSGALRLVGEELSPGQ